MHYYLTIDAGTSNTRGYLWGKDCKVLSTHKVNVGVRNTAIDGNNSKLKAAVKECIDTLTVGIELSKCTIVASGMITSNVGLVEIPHLAAPIGLVELSSGVKSLVMDDICPHPINFIPGVKNHSHPLDLDNLHTMDMMRGEEVECIAMIQLLNLNEKSVFIIPGSHTKYIAVDEKQQITGCFTVFTGELLESITNYTIVADAVGKTFVEPAQYNKEMVLRGYVDACNTSMSRVLFQTRIMSLFTKTSKPDIANYLLGAVLSEDISALKGSITLNIRHNDRIVITGKQPLKDAFMDILTHSGYSPEAFELADSSMLSGQGAIAVMQEINKKGVTVGL